MTNLPKEIAELLDAPIAVLGEGVSGYAVLGILQRLNLNFICYDEFSKEPEFRSFNKSNALKHKLVIYSPGFIADHPWLVTARKTGCVCIGEIDFAYLLWKGRIVAITGTNGKTTLTEFLAHAYRVYGFDAVAVGNNGFAFSSLVNNSSNSNALAICEVSSFQSEALHHFQSEALLWTNFSEDHLDRYKDLKAYFDAKWNLVKSARHTIFIVGKDVVKAANYFGYKIPKNVKVADSVDLDKANMNSSSYFRTNIQLENLKMVVCYWRHCGFPIKILQRALSSFTPRKHRFQKIAEINDISFWNDSKATNFASTERALSSFQKPVMWIGGGKSKKGDIEGFSQRIAKKIRAAFLIGEVAPVLESIFHKLKVPVHVFNSLEEAISASFQIAIPGDAVILSPAFASYDMFADYIQRGICFENKVMNLNQVIKLYI